MPRQAHCRHGAVIAVALVCTAAVVLGQPPPLAAPFPALPPAAAASLPNVTIPFFPGRSSIMICTGERIPVVMCNGLDPANYSGYEIDMFRAIMPFLGWEERMLDWRCMDRAQLRAQLAANSSSGGGNTVACDLLVAGLPLSTIQLAQGVSFTYPTSGDAYGLLVKAEGQPNETWRFLDAFSWQLWVAIPLTSIAAGCIVWALDKAAFWGERRAAALNEPKSPLAPATISAGTLNEKIWEGLGRAMGIQPPLARSMSGRLVWLTFGFMIMVLVTLYTSVTAATITAARLAPRIQSRSDLVGKTVGTSTFFNGTLPPRVVPVRYSSDGAMLAALLNEEVDVLMLPFSYLLHSLVFDCRVEIVGQPFSWYDRAFALPPGARNDALIAAMNDALLQLNFQAQDTRIAARYWPSPDQDLCPFYNSASHIGLAQVSGLWIVLAIGVVLAFLLASWPLVPAWQARRRQAAAQQAAGPPLAGKSGGHLLPLSAAGNGKVGAAHVDPPAQAAVPQALPASQPPPAPPAAAEPAADADKHLDELLQAQQELLQQIDGILQQQQEQRLLRRRSQRLPAAHAAPSAAPSRRITLVGMLLLLLHSVGGAAGQQAGSEPLSPTPAGAANGIPLFPGRTTINICTTEQTPMAYCVDRVPLNYTGYQVEVLNALMPALDWTPPMLNWSCMTWDDLLASLMAGDGSCDIAVAGMQVDFSLLQGGLTFSWPTVRATTMGYLGVIQARDFGMWSFLNSFTWQLWLALWGTAACVGLVVWSIDLYSGWTTKCLTAAVAPKPQAPPRLLTSEQWKSERTFAEHYTYASLGRFMRICIWKTRTDPARIVVLCYAFLQLTLALVYIANTTANVTAFTLKTAASDVAKLKSIGTWEAYRGRVPEVGQAEIKYFPWDSLADEMAMLSALKNGEVQALWMPETFLAYVAASDCTVAVVEDHWIPGISIELRAPGSFDVAFAFARGFNNTGLQDKMNAAILALKESQLLARIVDEELTRPSQCNRNSLPRQAAQLGFQQVAGLWVLLAIAVAAGILLAALPHVTYAAADAWAARRARRSLAASPDIAVWSSKSSAGWNQASNASLKASSSSIQSMRLPSSGSLKVAASQGDASGAAACTQVDPPPPHPLRAASLRHVGVHAAEEAAQQAVPEPAAFLNPDAGEAAAADEDEDERLAALLEAQRAVEQAVGMLQEQLLRRRR